MKITITTYESLQEIIQHFMLDIYELLIIEGAQGIGKSSAIKQVFRHLDPDTDYCWLEGRISPPVFYEKLYEYLDSWIILDDCDSLLSEKANLNLLKTLCQTDRDKRVSWQTTRKLPHNIPSSFYTSSTVIMITNEFKKLGVHLRAIEDRGLHVLFQPSIASVHAYAQKLCSTEVYSFFEMFLHTIQDLSLRQYVIAERLYQQGLEWRQIVSNSWQLDTMVQLYITVTIEYPHLSQEERKEKFLTLSKKSEKTYNRVIETLINNNKSL